MNESLTGETDMNSVVHRFFLRTWYNGQRKSTEHVDLQNMSYEAFLNHVEKNKNLKQIAQFFSCATVVLAVASAFLLWYSAGLDSQDEVTSQATNLTICVTLVSIAFAIRGFYGVLVSYKLTKQLKAFIKDHDEVSWSLSFYPIWGEATKQITPSSPCLNPEAEDKKLHEDGKFLEFWKLSVGMTLCEKGRKVPYLKGGLPDEQSNEYATLRRWYVVARLVGVVEREGGISRFLLPREEK